MSYIYLQEQGEASSAEYFSDIEPFVRSRLNLTAEKSSCNDSETESCLGSRSGMMFVPSTESRGEALQTLCAEGSPARTLAEQTSQEKDLTANTQDSGEKWQGWFAKLDPISSMWKTAQCSLFGDSDESLETWPQWGTMQDGVVYQLRISEDFTVEKESGLLPTPRKSDANGPSMVRTKAILNGDSAHRYQLRETLLAIKNDFTNKYAPPNLYERLMEWPEGWTGLQPVGMDNFQEWRREHGRF